MVHFTHSMQHGCNRPPANRCATTATHVRRDGRGHHATAEPAVCSAARQRSPALPDQGWACAASNGSRCPHQHAHRSRRKRALCFSRCDTAAALRHREATLLRRLIAPSHRLLLPPRLLLASHLLREPQGPLPAGFRPQAGSWAPLAPGTMLPRAAGSLLSALARPGSAMAGVRGFAAAAAAAPGPHFCIVGSGPAGFYTADKVSPCACAHAGSACNAARQSSSRTLLASLARLGALRPTAAS